jgi:glycosyltransferase involved in cell wall biosynthesis
MTAVAMSVRIAYCIDNMNVGGTELNALRTAERLDRSRFTVQVVALNTAGPLLERYRAAGIPVHHQPVGSLYAPRTAAAIMRLARHLRNERIDIVHAHDRYTDFVCTAAARLARVPVVLASKRWSQTTRRHRLTSAVGFRLAHYVVANGASVAESLPVAEGVRRERVLVVPNFVDDRGFDAPDARWVADQRRALGIAASDRVICCVASLRPIKDHPTLLRAVARLAQSFPACRLLLVGDGPSRPMLEAMARELDIGGRVTFAGVQPQYPSLHALAEIATLTSTSEGFPNTLVEAMALAKAVVATDVAGIRDAVRPGVNGLLVPPGDDAALAGAFARLLADPALARALGDAGRATAGAQYRAAAVVERLQALYEGLLARRR